MSKDKPDNVVDAPGSLAYPTNVGAPSFELPDVVTDKDRRSHRAGDQIQTKFDELKDEYFRLKMLAEDTDMVYNAHYAFIPIIGKVYHLYRRDEGLFLSLIGPSEWSRECLGSFRYTSESTWERV